MSEPQSAEDGTEVARLRAELAEVTGQRDAYSAAMHEMVTAVWKVKSMVELARRGNLNVFEGDALDRLERAVTGVPTDAELARPRTEVEAEAYAVVYRDALRLVLKWLDYPHATTSDEDARVQEVLCARASAVRWAVQDILNPPRGGTPSNTRSATGKWEAVFEGWPEIQY